MRVVVVGLRREHSSLHVELQSAAQAAERAETVQFSRRSTHSARRTDVHRDALVQNQSIGYG